LKILKDEASAGIKDFEKRIKYLEQELLQVQEDASTSERHRKQIELERDELMDEKNNTSVRNNLVLDEKRRLETKITNLEEELEEELNNRELGDERLRKITLQYEQCLMELNAEKSNFIKMDNQKNNLEKANKELRLKLTELETSTKTRSKTTITNLESKIAQLEGQLDNEGKERLALQKALRRNDKKLKEVLMNLEDERRSIEIFKEQNDKTNFRVRSLKSQLDESEEELSKEKSNKRKLQREFDDLQEVFDSNLRELNLFKSKMRRPLGSTTTTPRSIVSKRNSEDIDFDDDLDDINSPSPSGSGAGGTIGGGDFGNATPTSGNNE